MAVPEAGVLIAMRSMSERSFIDTNVLVYTDDNDEPAKQEIALGLIEEIRRKRTGFVSTQGCGT